MAATGWDRHKETILNLSCLENMPLEQVISYMKEKHNFVKSKRSYENQIVNNWGVRKNLGQKCWQYIGYRINKRQQKKTEITLCGVALSREKVQKEIQRYKTIPTAIEFGTRLPSPDIPEGMMIVRIQTPPLIEPDVSWPNSLPWFCFKNRVLPKLYYPSAFLRAFFDTSTQFVEFDKESPYIGLRNALQLRQRVISLSNTIPDDSIDREKKAKALTQDKFPPCLVTEMLKIIFFRLSNKLDKFKGKSGQSIHDQFVLHLVKAVSCSNPEMLSTLFSGNCATTSAIKESVYGSAVREKDYGLVKTLLQSGVNPNLPIESDCGRPYRVFKRGIIELEWAMWLIKPTAMQIAIITHDLHLGKILLGERASINNSADCLVEIAAYASELANKHDGALEFLRLLVEHGAKVNPLQACSCGGVRVSLIFALAITGKNNHLSEFLIEKGATADLSGQLEPVRPRCSHGPWCNRVFRLLRIEYTPIFVAIILGNTRMVEQLLYLILSCPMQTSLNTTRNLLLLSCLVGDAATTLKLLKSEDVDIDLTNEWDKGITPLVASAWNLDTRIAQTLLDLGADVGKTRKTSMLCPIHVAAFHGNTSLVCELIKRGADYNVQLEDDSGFGEELSCLAPMTLSCPLQFALASKNADTIKLLLSHLNISGGDSCENAFISDFNSKESNVPAAECTDITMAFGSAIRVRSPEIIRHYLSSGEPYRSDALHLATVAAVKSKDYSIPKLLMEYRSTCEIDCFEASSMVLSIAKGEWDLLSLFLCDQFIPGAAKSFYVDFDLNGYIPSPRSFSEHSGTGITPLLAELLSGNIRIVRNMIQRGFIPQDSDSTILIQGGIHKHKILDTIRTEILSKFSLHRLGFEYRASMVAKAIQSGDMEKVRETIGLVESLDICVLKVVFAKYSPLELAAKGGHTEIVSFLLDAGADPDYYSQSFSSSTALEIAAYEGHLNIVEVLLYRRNVVNPSFQRQKMNMALRWAAARGHLNIARLLIEQGADIDEPLSSFGTYSVIDTAANYGRLDMIQLFLEKGISLEKSMRIYYVRSVIFAIRSGHFAIVDLLKQYGSWSERDQRLYDCLHCLPIFNVCPKYDEDTDTWHISSRRDNLDYTIPPRLGTGHEEKYRQYRKRSLRDASFNHGDFWYYPSSKTAHISQTRWNEIHSTPTKPSNPDCLM
ncbi:ankyrin repeat-containing domain protein [Xylaria arbuscula]|nr:ankyrin repeat-containing domain protein [Xylaria arbuscula]